MAEGTTHFQITEAAVAAERFKRDAEGRFVNLDGSGPHPFKEVYKWAVADKLAGRRRKSPARVAVPTVTPDPAKLSVPPARGEGARLTWLGHASWLVQLGGQSLLIDPVLGDSVSVVIKRNGEPPCRPRRCRRSPRSS